MAEKATNNMTLALSPPPTVDARAGRTTLLLMLMVMLLAGAVRWPQLGQRGYILDELWIAEIATGRGSAHLYLPKDTLLNPPELDRLPGAPPWWQVWTHMEITHPPLYFVLLRIWENIFGDSDSAGRMFALVASVLAVGVLFDVARLLNGRSVAIWASVLMALSPVQIALARMLRDYAMLLLVGLIAANALVRIEKLGFSRRRLWGFGLAVMAMLLTHYFCIGAVAALGIYALIRLNGATRRKVIAIMVLAGVIFVIVWGPFMWQQRHLFNTSDDAVLFLKNNGPHHVRHTLTLTALLPAELLTYLKGPMIFIGASLAVLYVLPFFLLHRRRDILLWGLWLSCTVAVIALMDLTRKTDHLNFIRYTLLAGPAVYVLIPAILELFARSGWVRHGIPTVVALVCALNVPDAYQTQYTDPTIMVNEIGPMIHPNDLVVFVGTGTHSWTAGIQYLALSRYLHPIPCPIAILNEPADGQVLARARSSRAVFIFTEGQPGAPFIPGAKLIKGRRFVSGVGSVWIVDPRGESHGI